MSLKKKLMLTMICIAVVPITLLGGFCYGYFKHVLLLDIQQRELQNTRQTIYVLDNFFLSLSKISNSISVSETLMDALERTYSGSAARVLNYQDKQRVEDILYRNGYYLDSRIDTIAVFPENSNMFYYCTKQTINPNYDVKEEPWYSKITENEGALTLIGVHENNLVQPPSPGEKQYCITLGRNLYSPQSSRLLGTILINVNVKDLQGLWPHASSGPEEKSYLIDDRCQVVYSDIPDEIGERFFLQELHAGVTAAELDRALCDVIVSESDYQGWKSVKVIMRSKMNQEIAAVPYITVALALILIALSVIMSHFISRVITQPLQELYTRMRWFEAKKSGMDFQENQVGVRGLSSSYNRMISEINDLTMQNYEKELQLRKTELLALQFQINPHFVYNTLNSIKWMAEMQGSRRMVTALDSLIKLLQFSSKNSQETILIQDEIQFIQDYLNLINLKYFDKIQVDFNVEPEAECCETLRFLLQPIVENAVYHGFGEREQRGKNAVISINIRRAGEKILYEVTDNGMGMTEEQADQALKEEHSGNSQSFNKIGLYNVNMRIKYTFGSEYGMKLESKLGEYTKVLVEIPAHARKEEQK